MNVSTTTCSDVVISAALPINWMPSSILGGKAPIQCLSPSAPIFLIPPEIFECVCFVHITRQQWDKVDTKDGKCIFMGYPSI